MKSGCLWLFLYAVAVLPFALFGASMAGSLVYEYDHRHQPRLSDQDYDVLKNEWEDAAALAGGAPVLLLVVRSHLKRRRGDGQKAASAPQATGDEDGTVWPPPPQA